MSFKITVIGAGSIGFTRTLMHDVLNVPEFAADPKLEICFHDVSARNLDMVYRLMERDIKENHLPTKLTKSLNRRAAVSGARYVINTTRIGGLEAFATDVEIPLKYGVDQCVGDTLCAGGIMYGQRNVPAILDFCRDIREVAEKNALFLNYANPNAMNTWAALQYGGVRTLGLCHGVEGGHWQIASAIEHYINKGKKKGDKGYREIDHRRDVDIVCAGINHQTWYVHVLFDGEDWANDPRLLQAFATHPEYSKTEKVRIDMLRRFGYYSTESNGHLSEYVPWYRKRPADIKRWIDLGCWINGETGGYLRVCTEGRNWFETDFPNWLKEKAPVLGGAGTRSHEHGSYIIEALETGRVYRGHFNFRNDGCIANLPADAIVEAPAYVDHNGISVPRVGDLPLGCAAVCQNSINVQRLAVEAAVRADVTLLKQAMMLDPLVGAVCDPREISQMTDEMLIAGAKWLPQYASQMAAIKKRFASEEKLGTRKTAGAARLHTKTVAEMRKDKQAQAMARKADKGNPDAAQVGKAGKKGK
ncbi:MAG: alpha-galactosidase [Planctomycetes bacterium]|nr:alpha-galactosidase [Planctomycetota bacterium]